VDQSAPQTIARRVANMRDLHALEFLRFIEAG
jgi:hypothetical protein